ncbi:T9SS type A sorting domain-containing protein [Marivirga tractuosa]|uniref:T9SS type A sorting domain-containing protein n=1 Tax=Marivirga tractuosa TaxID=1006 RepID=UPI0035D08A47
MKKILLLFPSLLFFISFCFTTQAQVQEWQSIQNFPDSRSGAVRFVIGDTAYVGTGYTGSAYKKSFYKYNPEDGNWRVMNDYPGAAREGAVAFVADGKAYVGTGSDGTTQFKDFYEYDPSTGNWTATADLPGEIRNQASSFSINDKGYVGLGGNNTGSLSDFYVFEPSTGTWTAIASLPPDQARSRAVGFASNGKGYIASGVGSIQLPGLYSYDPTDDSWTEEIFADSKLSSLQQNTNYTDSDGLVHILKLSSRQEQVIIDPADNSLTLDDSYFVDERNRGVAFYLNGEAYAGLGYISEGFDITYQNDFRKLASSSPEEPEPIEAPASPTNLILSKYNTNTIFWEDNSDNEEGFNIFLSKDQNSNYQKIGTVGKDIETYAIEGLQRDTKYFVKVEAFNDGGISESNEINFYGIFKSGKLNRPELLTIFNRESYSLGSQYLVFENRDKHGRNIEVERSINNQDFENVDNFLINGWSVKIDTITFYENYPDNITSIDYRIRLTADNRIPSEYSDSYSLDLKELKPESGKIILDGFENSWSDKESVHPTINFEDYLNIEDLLVYKMENDSSIHFMDTLNYQWRSRLKFREGEKLNLFTIATNVFGADTSEIFNFQIPLRNPEIRQARSAGEATVGFSFISSSFRSKYSIIQKSTDGVSFSNYDSVKVDNKSFDDNIRYFDKDVEANQTYYYRVKNVNEFAESFSTSEIIELTAVENHSWIPYRKQTMDSLIAISDQLLITNINYHEGKLYFLSAQSQEGLVYDLDSDTFEEIPPLPTSLYEGWFMDVEIVDNKIFCFSIERTNDDDSNKFWIYDLDLKKWIIKELPDKYYHIKRSFTLNDNEILLVVKSTFFNPNQGLVKFYIDQDSIVDNDLIVNDIPTHIEKRGDSIRLFGNSKMEYIVDKDLKYKRMVSEGNSSFDHLDDRLITNYKNRKLQLSNRSIYEVNTNDSVYLKHSGSLPFEESTRSLAFVHNDTLIYYPSHTVWLGKRFKINNFYYKNYSAPKPVQIIKGIEGFDKIDLEWTDSNNEEGYILKYRYIRKDNGYRHEFDTLFLDANVNTFELTELSTNSRIEVVITPYNENETGESVDAIFNTLDPKPNTPIITSIKQESAEGIELSWELTEPYILVEELSLNRLKMKSNGPSQKYIIKNYEENTDFHVEFYALNEYEKSDVIYSDTILTRLYSPYISEVAYFEKEGKYQVVVNDSSKFETLFKLYRKAEDQEDFELLETIEGNQPNEFTFDDFIDDPSIKYEYYVQSYLVENDSVINSSFPSDTISTENAVLSNTPLHSDELSIFPNPANDHIFISSDLNIQLQRIEVLSLEGRQIKTFEASDMIDVSELEKGIYLLKIKAKSGEVTKRFIKE